MTTPTLRGDVKALLDEYKKVVEQLNRVIQPISNEKLIEIVDSVTDDPNCKTIQKILTHVVRAGYNYTIAFENHIGVNTPFVAPDDCQSTNEYVAELTKMFHYCETFFYNNPSLNIVEKDSTKKITTCWNQQYDIEQLMEHAIVHILRHRRQIEKYI